MIGFRYLVKNEIRNNIHQLTHDSVSIPVLNTAYNLMRIPVSESIRNPVRYLISNSIRDLIK